MVDLAQLLYLGMHMKHLGYHKQQAFSTVSPGQILLDKPSWSPGTLTTGALHMVPGGTVSGSEIRLPGGNAAVIENTLCIMRY